MTFQYNIVWLEGFSLSITLDDDDDDDDDNDDVFCLIFNII